MGREESEENRRRPTVIIYTNEELQGKISRLDMDLKMWFALIDKYGRVEDLIEEIRTYKWLLGDDK